MENSTASISVNALRNALPIVFAIVALALVSARAPAAEPDDIDVITVSAPVAKTLGPDATTVAPIERITVTARVQFDPVTLTTNSGVALLKDAVLDAARKACADADPLTNDGGVCVRRAVESAEPQVDAVIARARSSANG
jgi:UrcA family protein